MWDDSSVNIDQAGGYGESPATGRGGQNRTARNEPFLPVTCATIDAVLTGEEKITIGAKEFVNLNVVGEIVDSSQTELCYNFTLTDDNHATTIKLTAFKVGHDNGVKHSKFVRGDTVRVYGRLRQFDGTKTINIYKMLPVTDPKEVELQALEVKIAEAYWMKGIANKIATHQLPQVLETSMFGSLEKRDVGNTSMNAAISSQTMSHRAPIQQQYSHGLPTSNTIEGQVTELLKQHTTMGRGDSGVGVAFIHKLMPSVDKQRINKQLEFLVNEGHAYVTISDGQIGPNGAQTQGSLYRYLEM